MIRNLLKRSTRGKQCAESSDCPRCSLRKALKPRIYVEDPDRLTIPVIVNHYKYKKPTTVNNATGTSWKWSFHRTKPKKNEPKQVAPKLCAWSKKRRALRRLKLEKEKEKKRLHQEQIEKARKQRESEIYEHLRKREELRKAYPSTHEQPIITKTYTPTHYKPPPKPYTETSYGQKPKVYFAPPEPSPPPPPPPKPTAVKVIKKKKVREAKAITAKTKAVSKYVTVKKYEHYQSPTERFVNCVYRTCCQLFCCMTFFFILSFAIILFI